MDTDVLIIGAGVSGLVAARHLKAAGFEPVILEQSSRLGGLWAYDPSTPGGVMERTCINVSKYNYAFADHAMPRDYPDFPSHAELYRYIQTYAQRFGLTAQIRFRERLEHLEHTAGRWRAVVRRLDTDQSYEINARSVAVAAGHHRRPLTPSIEGLETFTGRVTHGCAYKSAQQMGIGADQVLVVGFGNSAVDVACDAARTGASVTIVARAPGWVVPQRIFGYPADLYVSRAFLRLPLPISNWIFQTVLTLAGHNPRKLGYAPKVRALAAHPTVSADLFGLVERGQVRVVEGSVSRVTARSAQLSNGQELPADVIVLCTGYVADLEWLAARSRAKVCDKEGNLRLYLGTFVPEVGASLGFLGYVQPASGGLLPVAEQQARWFASVCRGQAQLPSAARMEAEIQRRRRSNARRYNPSARHRLQCDPLLFNDAIVRCFAGRKRPMRDLGLLWRGLLSSGGVDQWSLGDRDVQDRAARSVRAVPVPLLILAAAWLSLAAVGTALGASIALVGYDQAQRLMLPS